MTYEDYGYLRFFNSLNNGYILVELKIFEDLVNCFGDYNCSSTDSLKQRENLRLNNPAFSVKLKTGEYYGISKLRFGDMSFFNCETSNLTIYHGFQFKDRDESTFYTEKYMQPTCQIVEDRKVVCPPIRISKKGIFEIELSKNDIRSKSISISHLFEPNIIFSTFNLLYCGPISYHVNYISVKSKQIN